jgi:hypothetical protein
MRVLQGFRFSSDVPASWQFKKHELSAVENLALTLPDPLIADARSAVRGFIILGRSGALLNEFKRGARYDFHWTLA